MNRLGSRPDQDPEIKGFIEEFFPGYRETDMQFNIGRVEGVPARGMDIINPETQERLLVTHASSKESELLVRRKLGMYATFPRWEDVTSDQGLSTYRVPSGARSLIKTLRTAPFADDYMEHMHYRAGAFLRKLYLVDNSMFGLTINDIAIGHSGENTDDDTVFAVVPPLLESTQQIHRPLSGVATASVGRLEERFTPSFMAGLAGSKRE